MPEDLKFNSYAANEFVIEFERETGVQLRFRRVGERFPFPDAVLDDCNGREVGVEFVSVVLGFAPKECDYFGRYRRAFLDSIASQRPRYRNVGIRLQVHHKHIEHARPMHWPDINGVTGRRIVAEFARLLDEQFEALVAREAVLLETLRGPDGTLGYPTLSETFGAIMFRQAPTPHTSHLDGTEDDPVIDDLCVWYDVAEMERAVRQALEGKEAKGRAYSTDMLVLHTLPRRGEPDISGLSLCPAEIAELGRSVLADMPEIQIRFRQFWFLSRWPFEGKRLFRLQP